MCPGYGLETLRTAKLLDPARNWTVTPWLFTQQPSHYTSYTSVATVQETINYYYYYYHHHHHHYYFSTFIQDIYNYIPETTHISRVYSVADVLYLQFHITIIIIIIITTTTTTTTIVRVLPQVAG